MNQLLLAEMVRERQRDLRADFARGPIAVPGVRPLVARVLRASGDGLFRLGVALDEQSAQPVTNTSTV